MKNTSHLILIVAGILLIIFRGRFIRYSYEFQKKAFGFKYGDREETSGRRLAIIVGLTMIVIAVLNLLGVVSE